MKVLLISGVYPPRIGGPSLQTQRIAQGLIQRGVEVQVVTYGDRHFSDTVDGVPVTFLDGQPYPGLIQKIWRNVRVYRNLKQVIQSFQPTVIQMQAAAGNLAILSGILAKQHRIPSVVKYTADLVWERSNEHKLAIAPEPSHPSLLQQLSILLLELTERFLFLLYDCIWATTPIFQEQLIHRFHIPRKKILLLPNFIDLCPFQQVAAERLASRQRALVYTFGSPSSPIAEAHPPEVWTVLSVARLRPWKGVDQCIKAMAHLMDLPIRLKVVGDGTSEYETYLHQLAAQLEVSDRIEFVGAIPPGQIAEVYRTADLFVLASQYEPFGIVLLEAMAAGVPVIASNVDGIPTVVEDGISAQLVPPGDAHRLATAIRTLLKHPEQQVALSTSARQRAQAFDLETGIDTLLDTYQHLIAHFI
jgi:glycosyltransferase involved in cell wall biosynthesis